MIPKAVLWTPPTLTHVSTCSGTHMLLHTHTKLEMDWEVFLKSQIEASSVALVGTLI